MGEPSHCIFDPQVLMTFQQKLSDISNEDSKVYNWWKSCFFGYNFFHLTTSCRAHPSSISTSEYIFVEREILSLTIFQFCFNWLVPQWSSVLAGGFIPAEKVLSWIISIQAWDSDNQYKWCQNVCKEILPYPWMPISALVSSRLPPGSHLKIS